MFDSKQSGKIKNDKIQKRRVELAYYSFDIKYRLERENVTAFTLFRAYGSGISLDIGKLLKSLCQPGVTWMMHLVRLRNLPFFVNDVKRLSASFNLCADFFQPDALPLIKITMPYERLSADLKGTRPSSSHIRFLFTVIEEYSRFPFACPDMLSKIVIKCLTQLSVIFGIPMFVHLDRVPASCRPKWKPYIGTEFHLVVPLHITPRQWTVR